MNRKANLYLNKMAEYVKHRTLPAYLTVYMTMSMTVMLSLVLALTIGAYRNTVRTETEIVLDIGMQSVLAEYHQDLWKRYDLLGIDTSYGTGYPGVQNAVEHLRYYLDENLPQDRILNLSATQVDLPEYEFFTDRDGEVFREQVLLYMKDLTGIDQLETLFEEYSQTGPTGIFTKDYSSEEAENRSTIAGWPPPTKTETRINDEGEEIEEEVEVPIENPAGSISAMKGLDQLPLVVDDVAGVSTKAVLPQDYVSYRTDLCSGTGKLSAVSQAGGEILYQAYLLNHFGYYGHTKKDCALDYQLEYLLAGRDNDRDNLSSVVNRLLIVREASNVGYLLTDSAKQAEMDALAAGVAAVALVPELQPVLKLAILFGWAYLESLQDVRNLLLGGKVPLIKTAQTWRSGLLGILSPDQVKLGKDSGSGLDYPSYLFCLLLLQDERTKLFRTMDLCEMDLRLTNCNENFRIDGCMASCSAFAAVEGNGYRCDITRFYSYE